MQDVSCRTSTRPDCVVLECSQKHNFHKTCLIESFTIKVKKKAKALARGDSMDDYALNCPLYPPLATSLFEQLQSAADGQWLERMERRVRSIDRRMEPHAGRLGTGFFGDFR